MSFELTKNQILKEILKSGKDPVYFINNYARIAHPLEGLIPFKLYPFQEQLLHDFNDHRFNFRTFIHRLSLNRDAMYDCTTVGQYLNRIDAIYNKGALKKDRVKFAQRWEDEDPIFSEVA